MALLTLALAGCGSSAGGPPPGGRNLPRATRAAWTVLVYMNAANNLEAYSLENVDQMEQVPYSTNVNVVVQWKWLHEAGTAADQGFDSRAPLFDGTRRFWISGRGAGNYNLDQVQDLGSGAAGTSPATVDMGDYHSLQSFIQWGETNFPADHTIVVLWNHGAGWEHRAAGRPAPVQRGVSYDDQSGNSIETWQLPQAFSGVAPPDVVAFDASLMQMIEVAYEIRSDTSYVVGSEDSPPGDGYPYDQWLNALVSAPSTTPLNVSDSICDTFVTRYQQRPDSNGLMDAVQQSVVQTSALPGLASSVNTLGTVLYNNRATSGQAFASARDTAHEYAFENGVTIYGEYKDLVEYCNLLEQDAPGVPGLNAAAEAVKTNFAGTVLHNKAILSDSFSNGLSIYVPTPPNPSDAPHSYDSSYGNLQFAQDTTWGKWLQNQAN